MVINKICWLLENKLSQTVSTDFLLNHARKGEKIRQIYHTSDVEEDEEIEACINKITLLTNVLLSNYYRYMFIIHS